MYAHYFLYFLKCYLLFNKMISTIFYIYIYIYHLLATFHEHQFSSVQLLIYVQLFVTPWPPVCQASISITKSWSLFKRMSIKSMMSSNHLILCIPFSLCLQSLPASGSFQMIQFFTSGGQSIGISASTSVLPMNARD